MNKNLIKFYFLIIKILILLIIIFYYNLKKNYLFKINNLKYYNFMKDIKIFINKFLNLKDIKYGLNDLLIKEEKLHILKLFSISSVNKVKNLKTIFYSFRCRFGNLLINLNKLLFYCEIIGCKNILLEKKIFWFLKHRINIKKKITIKVNDKNNLKSNYLISNTKDIFYSFFKIKPEIKINYLRSEIIRNLPKFKTSKNDLYIHIRSGDIFKRRKPHPYYAQPPLCFYKKILNNYIFRKIYLIYEDKRNPIIEKLIYEYPNIIYKEKSFKEHISLLINAYNIVGSNSSFLSSILQLNYNLQFLWDHNFLKLIEKIRFLHYDLYKYPHNNFTIFRMEPSPNYRKFMNIWKNNKKQRKLMIKEKCINDFLIIKKIV